MASRGINKVILIGNLGQDPEVRYMPNGGAVTNITLATSDSWRDKTTGDIKEQTEWHRVVIFGKLAEIAGEYLRKGSHIYVEGQLRTRKWTDQLGQEKYTTEVIVNINGTMQMLGSRQSGDQQQSGWSHHQLPQSNSSMTQPRSHQQQSSLTSSKDVSMDFDDDIPF